MLRVRAWTAAAATVLVATACLAGCSEDSGAETDGGTDTATTESSSGLEVPDGVQLSEAGSTLDVGDAASVIYRADENRRSVVTVTVRKIRKGKMSDFKGFSLDDKTRASTPYYVDVTIRNEGPGGLSRAAVPLYALDSTNAYFAPTALVGEFDKCAGGALPDKFYPGDRVSRCLLFLVPEDAKLASVQVRTADLDQPVSWKP